MPHQEAMRGDPLLKYFYDLRSEILKEGTLKAAPSMYVEHLVIGDLMQPLMEDRPTGATGWFVGDRLGGSGWEVELPDGTTEKYYVALPDTLSISFEFHFENPPTEHKGEPLLDTSVEALAQNYIAYLKGLVNEAGERFGPARTT